MLVGIGIGWLSERKKRQGATASLKEGDSLGFAVPFFYESFFFMFFSCNVSLLSGCTEIGIYSTRVPSRMKNKVSNKFILFFEI